MDKILKVGNKVCIKEEYRNTFEEPWASLEVVTIDKIGIDEFWIKEEDSYAYHIDEIDVEKTEKLMAMEVKSDELESHNIEFYEVIDYCYRGNCGSHPDDYPKGSAIFRSTDESKCHRIVNAMNPVAREEHQLELSVHRTILVLDEQIDVSNMTDEEIVNWVKRVSK